MPGPTVYIPNLNGGDRLLRALESLSSQSLRPEVVVIDNGSSDGSLERVRADHPDTHTIDLGSNWGFGRAINEGVRRIAGDPIILLNNDCVCEPQVIEALVDAWRPEDGSVAGVLVSPDGRIESAGVEADSTLLCLEYLHGASPAAAIGARPPLGPTGGIAAYASAAFRAVGGFDDNMFAYLEDLDLALRLADAGYSCRLAGSARAVHAHSQTLGTGSPRKNEMMGFSRGYMLGRYRVLDGLGRTARAIASEAVLCGGQLVVDRNATGITARVRGYRLGRSLPRRKIPAKALVEAGALQSLGQRLRQRRNRPA